MPAIIRAILFDMDGLLIDTEDLHMRAFAEAATQLGYPSKPEHYLAWIGHSSMSLAQWLAQRVTAGTTPQAIVDLERDIYFRILREERPQPLPGVRAWLDHCDERRLGRGLVSSTVYEQLVPTMQVVLAHLGRPERVEDTFGIVTSGDRVPRMKPAPDPYLQTAQALGVEPHECIVFEDSPAGVAAGRAAGCHVVAIPNVYLKAEDVAKDAHLNFPTLEAAFQARVWERL